jgi:hypothetical protein
LSPEYISFAHQFLLGMRLKTSPIGAPPLNANDDGDRLSSVARESNAKRFGGFKIAYTRFGGQAWWFSQHGAS